MPLVKSSAIYYTNLLFGSRTEIRKWNYVGQWKSQCNLRPDQRHQTLKDKCLKYRIKGAATAMDRSHHSPEKKKLRII